MTINGLSRMNLERQLKEASLLLVEGGGGGGGEIY